MAVPEYPRDHVAAEACARAAELLYRCVSEQYVAREQAPTREFSGCCQVPTYYHGEHDNFYCTECDGGQGDGYYKRNILTIPVSDGEP